MSERGVFAVDRGIWDHAVFRDQPFTDREAWMWLVGEASFKSRTRNVAGKMIPLERGQLAASVRFMAEKWKWSKSSVDRFLVRLKSETMIGTDSGTGLLVITICNYDEYQRVSLPTGTPSETTSGTVAGQSRDKRESTESTEVVSEAKASGADAPPDPSIAERELFERGKALLGKSAGGQIVKLLRAKGGNVALARAAIEAASQKHRPAEYIAACIRGSPQAQGPPPDKGGFVAILMEKHLERQNGTGNFDPDEFEPYRASG